VSADPPAAAAVEPSRNTRLISLDSGLMPPQVKSVVPVYRAWERWMQMMHKRDAGAPGRRTVTMRRTLLVVVAAVVLAGLSGCSSTVSGTPTANLVSEQGLSIWGWFSKSRRR